MPLSHPSSRLASATGVHATGASAIGALATGASAIGALAIGALAIGALAIGSVALGALAIGRLKVGRARLRRVEIGELVVDRLTVASGTSPFTLAIRIQAAPGKGDEMERLLLDELPAVRAEGRTPTLRRSVANPDLFLIDAHHDDADRRDHAQWLDLLREHLAEQGLVEGNGEGAIRAEMSRAVSAA